MAFMNFFKNQDDREDIEEDDDKPIGGFRSWKEALESMKNDQINKHKDSIKDALEKIIEDKNLDELKVSDIDNKLIDKKAIYFEDNKDILEEKYEEKNYDKLIYKFSEDIINEYNF